MIRPILACIFCCCPLALGAQPVTVISGEHAGFSRLVVMFDSPHDWQFGRVAGGYELRTDARSAQLAGPQIFDFIPRTRISAVSFPGPGRMFLAVTCTCTADLFELRQGRLAIDIKDGAPDQTSRFEGQIPPLADGAIGPNDATQPGSAQAVTTNPGPQSGRVNEVIALLQKNFPTVPQPLSPETATAQMADLMQAPVQLPDQDVVKTAQSAVPDFVADQIQPVPDMADTRSGPDHPQLPEPDHNTATPDAHSGATPDNPTHTAATLNATSTGPILSAWPRDWDQILSDLDPPKTQRVALAETAILQQLSRAAAQGVVQLNLPDIVIPTPRATPMHAKVPDALMAPEDIDAVATSPDPVAADHIRVETVVDRDANTTPGDAEFTDLGRACLPDDLVQVADWGPDDVARAPLSDLRAKMLLEFDDPDSQIITGLARRYIYLGFGAEAINLSNSFPSQIEGADILLQMADIVDDGLTQRPGPLVSQLTCATTAAMWAVLAQTRIPGGIDVDTNNVLRTFAGLPVHLRRHLGPGLADRFLDAGNGEIAASIRDISARGLVARDAGFDMMQAHIAAGDGDMRNSLKYLREVVASGSPTAPQALAELLEMKLNIGDAISPKTAVLADAMAVENRGTQIGGRLTVAAIRSYAASGQVDVTFERIASALDSGLITGQQAAILANEAHMRNAANTSDVDFLRALYLHPLVMQDPDKVHLGIMRAVAGRLIDIGLPKKAKQVYAHDPGHLGIADRQILARAELALGNFDAAGRLLQGADDAASALMLARASEMRRDYTTAAQYYDTLDMHESRESAAWRGGDWPLVAKVGTDRRAQLAALLIAGDPMADFATTDAPDGEVASGNTDVTIAGSKTLLAQSQGIRELVDGLLTPPRP